MELQVGVKVLLKNPEGKFLLLKRNAEKYPEVKESWDIVGGRIDPGKTLLDNLRREVKEETGLELKDETRLVGAQDILKVPGRHVVRLTYVAEIQGTPKLDEDHSEYKWFTLEELKQMPASELDRYFKELLDKDLFN